MTGRFILSLDCEGKWGVTHHLGAQEQRTLSDASLRRAYGAILELLDEFEIPATFAFVGLFGETPASFRRLRPKIDALTGEARRLIVPALRDLDSGSGEGWHGDWAVEAVANARVSHEIAYQGSTHVPWDLLDASQLGVEQDIYRELESPVGNSRTMVFPRNRVAATRMLPSMGIKAYRTARTQSRARSLAGEFNLLAQSQRSQSRDAGGTIAIPSGFFVNWQHGLRRIVPAALSLRRLSHLLDHAERTGGIVHYWLHPENVASAPATLNLLRGMMERVAKARSTGGIDVITQWDYCRDAEMAGVPGANR